MPCRLSFHTVDSNVKYVTIFLFSLFQSNLMPCCLSFHTVDSNVKYATIFSE